MEKDIKKMIEKIVLTPEQLDEFLTSGRFPITKKYLGGNIEVDIYFFTDKERSIVFLKHVEEKYNGKKIEELTDEEYNEVSIDVYNEMIKETIKIYKVNKETKSRTRINYDEIIKGVLGEEIIKRDLSLAKKEYYSLLEKGEYNPLGEAVIDKSAKKLSGAQENS